jgi:hypothetical protein
MRQQQARRGSGLRCRRVQDLSRRRCLRHLHGRQVLPRGERLHDSACKSSDDTLDACEAKAEKAGHGLPECYDAFGATSALAKKRADCIRSSCAKECLGATR